MNKPINHTNIGGLVMKFLFWFLLASLLHRYSMGMDNESTEEFTNAFNNSKNISEDREMSPRKRAVVIRNQNIQKVPPFTDQETKAIVCLDALAKTKRMYAEVNCLEKKMLGIRSRYLSGSEQANSLLAEFNIFKEDHPDVPHPVEKQLAFIQNKINAMNRKLDMAVKVASLL